MGTFNRICLLCCMDLGHACTLIAVWQSGKLAAKDKKMDTGEILDAIR